MTKMQRNGRARTSERRAGRVSSLPLLAVPIIVIAVVAVLVTALFLSASNQRLQRVIAPGSDSGSLPTALPLASGPVPYPDVLRITLQAATKELEIGRAVLIDVRSRTSYDKAHAAGALSFPEDEIQARIGELPADQDLILYWTWGQEQQSARVAQMLGDQGLANVHALLGGFAAWQRAGLPIETSPQE